MNYKNYFFYDEATGEEFIVQEETLEKAQQVAEDYFENPDFQYTMTDLDAEMSGLDVY